MHSIYVASEVSLTLYTEPFWGASDFFHAPSSTLCKAFGFLDLSIHWSGYARTTTTQPGHAQDLAASRALSLYLFAHLRHREGAPGTSKLNESDQSWRANQRKQVRAPELPERDQGPGDRTLQLRQGTQMCCLARGTHGNGRSQHCGRLTQ